MRNDIAQQSALYPHPRLRTPRLELGPLEAAHAPALLEILGDPEVTRYHDLDCFLSLTDSLRFIAEMMARHHHQTGIRWAATETKTGQLVGTVGLNHLGGDSHRCSIGYEFRRSIWRRGLATEAVQAVTRFAHDTLGMHRIEAAVLPDNAASLGLLRKLGFQQEGCLRGLGQWKGQFHDLAILSLLATDEAAR